MIAAIDFHQGGAVEQKIPGAHPDLQPVVVGRTQAHQRRVIDGLHIAAGPGGDNHGARAAGRPAPGEQIIVAAGPILVPHQLIEQALQVATDALDNLVRLQIGGSVVDKANKPPQGEDGEKKGDHHCDVGLVRIPVAGQGHQAVDAGPQEQPQAYFAEPVTEKLAQHLGPVLPGSQGEGHHRH